MSGNGGIVITDYKTGANLQDLASRAVQGEAPQLPLEAAIAAAGGFTGLAAGRVAVLRYISTLGRRAAGRRNSPRGTATWPQRWRVRRGTACSG